MRDRVSLLAMAMRMQTLQDLELGVSEIRVGVGIMLALHSGRMARLAKKETVFREEGKFYTNSGDASDSQSDDETKVIGKAEAEETVESLTARISRRKLPPTAQSFEFFVERGLCGEGTTPHVIRVEKLVQDEECERLFGKALARKKFHFGDCKDPKVRARILNIWPLIYSKNTVPTKMSLEFTIAVVAETQRHMQVNWASFAVAMNKEQRTKYQAAVDGLAKKRSNLQLDCKNGGSECDSKITFLGTNLRDKLVLPDHLQSFRKHAGVVHFDSWVKKITTEISELRSLVSVEWLSSKQSLEKSSGEKRSLVERTRSEKGCLDSMRQSLALHMKHIEEPAPIVSERTAQGMSDLQLGDGKDESCGLSDANILKPEAPLQKTPQQLHRGWCEELVQGHETAFTALSAQLETATKTLEEQQRKEAFLAESQQILATQMDSLLRFKAGLLMFPHPLPYPVGLSAAVDFEVVVSCCEKCLVGFGFNDIILTSCRHSYHPFCALMHFRDNNSCAKPSCRKLVSPEWKKSFGFSEFDQEMLDTELSEGCKDARLQYLMHRRDVALALCPNVGKSFNLHSSSYFYFISTLSYPFPLLRFLGHAAKPTSGVMVIYYVPRLNSHCSHFGNAFTAYTLHACM
jgi:hypothetical protein